MVEAAGADLVDINFGCPVRKVTKTGAGASLLHEPHRAAAIVEAVAEAVDVPVCVKMRRGVGNGSRTALEVGPQLVEAGAASLTLHPRSAQQMYTGTADHALTAELVELVDVPVVASGDITSRGPRRVGPRRDRLRRGHGGPRGAGEPMGSRRDRRHRGRRAHA
jgi:tRNA-dihydrouridine synthase B